MDPQPNPPQPSPEAAVQPGIYQRAIGNLKTALGDAWEQRLSPEEQQLAIVVQRDIVDLLGESLSLGTDTGEEAKQILAQLANLKSIEADRLTHYILVAAGRAALDGAAWLVTATAPYLKGGVLAAII